ncbi:hypothetical protein [Reyranella sp.]|uniref:hypothetical protein n=1 Tax=Reyranella sp. TaxID=1929291 RepID=UPI0027307E6C|nr:hypothetical protein [Reyranella sp.]MDP2377812.1 hypothetical protein [Reyranella sp.]
MPDDSPAISVSGYRADSKRDVSCSFEHNGIKVDVHMPNAIAASEANREHQEARQVLLAAAEALANRLREA